jgi:NAD(P)-dependent dehydrogenase (short-subunit alcohol dehydrogenase family)
MGWSDGSSNLNATWFESLFDGLTSGPGRLDYGHTLNGGVVMSESKVAVVTGVSSGIGRATAAELARRGFRVFGTVRSAPTEGLEGVEHVVLDVRDDPSIERGIAEILAKAGRIDVLVNNAGSSILGAIEETDTSQARDLFDVNFFGTVRVTRAVLPTMRARRAGRIVFVSSVVGFLPAPFMGFYAATKHALEGYAESLDHEVRLLGIRALLVEPGFMKTRLDKNSTVAARRIDDYTAARERVGASINASVASGGDPAIVAKAIADALAEKEPKLRYPVGKGAGMLAKMRSLLPARMFDRGFRKQFHVEA